MSDRRLDDSTSSRHLRSAGHERAYGVAVEHACEMCRQQSRLGSRGSNKKGRRGAVCDRERGRLACSLRGRRTSPCSHPQPRLTTKICPIERHREVTLRVERSRSRSGWWASTLMASVWTVWDGLDWGVMCLGKQAEASSSPISQVASKWMRPTHNCLSPFLTCLHT